MRTGNPVNPVETFGFIDTLLQLLPGILARGKAERRFRHASGVHALTLLAAQLFLNERHLFNTNIGIILFKNKNIVWQDM
ncbi:MAG: hypothetical protein NT175_01080 [Bacteroidetes bacterium]|nr:hypothetical protein [Bacteroidota bacterium]